MTYFRFSGVLAFAAAAATTTQAQSSNLRRRNLLSLPRCPSEIPEFGTPCQVGLECNYDYILIPEFNDDYTCTGELSCIPSTSVHCGLDDRWEPPLMMTVARCSGEMPAGAFRACDPSVPRGCPTQPPEFGTKCQAGTTCEYEHALFPTHQEDGSCTGPFSCSPMVTYECANDGTWEPPISLTVPRCNGGEGEFSAYQTCSPSRDSICPTEAPEPGSKCNRYTNLPECEYNFMTSPIIRRNGRCSRKTECVPTTGCGCSDEGVWECWMASPVQCANRPPSKTCEPNVFI